LARISQERRAVFVVFCLIWAYEVP
jgi:hypothetical protein